MHLLFLNTLYNPYETGGSGRSVEFLAEWFAKLGHEVSVLTTAVEAESQTRINGVDVIYKKHANIYTWTQRERESAIRRIVWHITDDLGLTQRRILRHLVKDIAPDIIMTNTIGGFSSAIFPIAAEAAIPLVHTLKGLLYAVHQKQFDERGQELRDTLCHLQDVHARSTIAVAPDRRSNINQSIPFG